MADRAVDVLIVGAGAAGSACASALVEGGFDGSVLLAGRDLDPPYERPFCSKDYLRGDVDREGACLELPPDVELVTRASVMKLDTEARVAKVAGAGEVEDGRALLATGANVRRLRVDGAQLEGIHYLRALGNADAIRAEPGENVVLIGGSHVACEVAATLTAAGKRCTLVMTEELPLSLNFGRTAGEFFGDVLRSHGVEWVSGDPLARFEGSGERVERVVTESGRVLEADFVVMGTGAVPDVMLARASGLELGETGGIACSATLETSAPGVWAAGDACEYDSVVHRRRLRVEHWEVARSQGAAVAAAMLGSAAPYDEIPYFWSDLSDWCTLEYVGPADTWDREVVRGSLADAAFTIFYLAGERVVAALTVGRSDDLDEARRLLREGAPVSDRELASV